MEGAMNIRKPLLVVACCVPSIITADQFGDFTFIDTGDAITITDYPDAATGEVVIPASINGKPVTVIGASAFQGCDLLSKVTIPDSVTTIEGQAFQQCAMLDQAIIEIQSLAYATMRFPSVSG